MKAQVILHTDFGSFPTEVLVRGARAPGGPGSKRVWHPVGDCHIKRNPKRPGFESSAALQLARAQLLCGWHHTLQTDRSGLTWVQTFSACILNAFICWERGFYKQADFRSEDMKISVILEFFLFGRAFLPNSPLSDGRESRSHRGSG